MISSSVIVIDAALFCAAPSYFFCRTCKIIPQKNAVVKGFFEDFFEILI